jgi:hypothetical protein
MTKKLIILNGPPGCGKDTLANYLSGDGVFCHIKFASELKVMTHRLYGVSDPQAIYQFENVKDVPNEKFYGLTPRQAYIAISEQYIKPVHGKGFFGDRLLEEIEAVPADLFIASDGGLIEELTPVAEKLGGENILVVKIYRAGCDFSNDSRGHYPDDELAKLSVDSSYLINEGLQDFFSNGQELIDQWLGVYEEDDGCPYQD